MSDTIIVAIIGAITAILSILGSVFITKLSAKQQKASEIRTLKQEWYNRFLEAFAEKMSYANNGTPLPKNVNAKFCLEFNRLPLYASEEVLNLANSIVENPNQPIFSLYSAIRKDLCNSKYNDFKSVSKFYFQVPM